MVDSSGRVPRSTRSCVSGSPPSVGDDVRQCGESWAGACTPGSGGRGKVGDDRLLGARTDGHRVRRHRLSRAPRRSSAAGGREQPYRSVFGWSFCLRPTVAGSALGDTHFRGHNAFTVVTAPPLPTPPRPLLSIALA